MSACSAAPWVPKYPNLYHHTSTPLLSPFHSTTTTTTSTSTNTGASTTATVTATPDA
ncbi:hypothetical protein AA313_de0200262 [Arthrobotrys entomopaga]|nr:hypothetical protein AA313_de0200262 [Arthrobotrys entomopaga]